MPALVSADYPYFIKSHLMLKARGLCYQISSGRYTTKEQEDVLEKILQTNITRTAWQTVRRITNEILEVKGLGSD